MAIRLAAAPLYPLFRIGRVPDPLAWPPRAFVETLDAFRPAIADLAATAQLTDGDPGDTAPLAGVIPDAFLRKVIVRLRLAPGQRWLDLRSPETHQALRIELARTLSTIGITGRFVWGDLLSHNHRLTQAISQWAYDHRYHGIVYSSCHDARLDCWALFDHAMFAPVGGPELIRPDDSDLVAVARLFELVIP